VHKPLTAAEIEAWSITGLSGAWRLPVHPRFKDRRPSLDWSAARQIHDPSLAPWPQVRVLLAALEDGARRGAKIQSEDEE
jgi:hypothetical protein